MIGESKTVLRIRPSGHGEHGLEYPAFSTTSHLLLPALLRFSLTDRSIDEPTEMPELKFPGWTLALLLNRAFSQTPAALLLPACGVAVSKKKQHLSLDMDRNSSPALFKALYSLERSSQQLGHLFLRFPKTAPDS